MKELKGFGITKDGRKVDINSPDFRVQDYVSVETTERVSQEEAEKLGWKNPKKTLKVLSPKETPQ